MKKPQRKLAEGYARMWVRGEIGLPENCMRVMVPAIYNTDFAAREWWPEGSAPDKCFVAEVAGADP